ncbi:prenyltransferase/squalene oxidase repeat-containing protein [Planctomycetota bacterium]
MKKAAWLFLISSFLILVALQFYLPEQVLKAQEESTGDNLNVKKEAGVLIAKTVTWLRSQMKEDTYWMDIQGKSPGYTALAVSGMIRAGYKYGEDKQVTKAVDWLVTLQKDDGGIYVEDYPNYYTSVIVMALADADGKKFELQLKKAAAFLKGLQFSPEKGSKPEDEGGIGYGSDKTRSDLSNTQYALDALIAAGVSKDDPVFKAAEKFISRCQNNSETNDQEWASDDGGFIYRPGDTQVPDGAWIDAIGVRRYKSYGSMTYAGLKSLIHCGATADDPRIQQALKWISNNYTVEENPMMDQQGVFYYFHTFAKTMSLLGMDTVEDDSGQLHNWRAEIVQKLKSMQSEDGSWVNSTEQRWMEGNRVLATCYALLTLDWVVQENPKKKE